MSRLKSPAALVGSLVIGLCLPGCGSTPGQSASHTGRSGGQRDPGSATVGEVIRIEILGAT